MKEKSFNMAICVESFEGHKAKAEKGIIYNVVPDNYDGQVINLEGTLICDVDSPNWYDYMKPYYSED